MAYEIDLPDGSRGRIHDDVPRAKALEVAKRAYPEAFPPPPTALGQALNAPRNIARGVGSGLVQAVGGLSSLPYAAARYFNPEMTPFAETGFGKSITETEQSLAPTDEGLGSQFAHGLGSFGSMLGPQAGLKGLGTVIKGVAPRAAAPVAVAQTAGLGAEEARQRVETARAEGLTVTPGQEFGSLVAGVPAGLTELLPIQNLFRATKGLSKASDLTPLAYGKRALQQGAVEGVQEAGSGALQDVIAQQIYNPDQEIGGSALKEGAMGAGVGGVAQVGLDLILRKDIRRDYQASLAKKDKEEIDKAMQAAKDTADADAASRPKEKMAAAQDKHPIYNPLGNFSAQKQTVADDGTTTQSSGLNADHLAFINKTRAEAGKPLLKSFSVEDLSDAGMPQQEISNLIAEKMGFVPSDTDVANAPQHIATVLNIAGQKNVDTDSQGFRDFLRRSTGTDDLNGMSPPQLFSAIKAVSALPISKTPLNLAGTSATRFSEEQYDVAINNLNADHTEDNALSLADTIDKIKGYTGLKNDVDAESLLHTAAGRGDLYAKSYPNPDGTTNINVHVPNANKVAGGPDVRENTYASDSVPESYVIKTSQGDLEEHATEDKAKSRIDTLSAARQGLAVRSTREAAKLGDQIAQSQTELDTMAAQGLTNTIEYQTKAAGLESKSQAKLAKIESLNAAAENLAEPLTIEPRGEKITTKSDYTLYDNNEAAGTFDSREEAQAHAVSKLPDDTLRQIIAAAPNQKGDLAAELSVMAQDELKARYGSVEGIREPHMVGNKKAEERLLSAGMFTGRFKEQAAELDRKLRPMMTRLGLGDLHLNIVNAIRASNESTADGEYSKKLIKIAIDAEKPMRVLRHEGVHALKELGAFSKDQWRVLENKAKSEWISKYNIIERYQGLNLSPEALIEEAIADAFSDFDQTKPPAGLIGAVFNKIKSFMEALGNSLDGIGFHTADSIFSKVEAGRLPATREPTSMEPKYGAFSLREAPKGETYNELNKTPEGAKVADLFLKHRAAEEKANKDRSMSQGRSEGEAARAFRRFNKALKEYTGNDKERQMKISGGLGTEQTLYDEAKDQGKFSLREGPPLPEKQARIYASELERLVKRVGERIAGMESGKTLEDVRTAVKKLQQYTNEGIKGKEWYEDSAKAILNAFNGDKVLAEKFFQIISITSANTEVAANFTKASKAWEQFARGAEIKVGTGRENKAVSDLLNFGIDWDGRKTNTFYSNFMDAMEGKDSGRSTIDLHMTRMLFDRDTPTDAQYELAENLVRLVASKRNLPARQVQAASWITQKAKTIFERYRAKGYKKALSDAQLREYAMEMAIVDYSHLLGKRTTPLPVTTKLQKPSAETRAETHVITGEVIPSVSSEMGQVAELKLKAKEDLNKIILDSGAIQGMARALNLKSKVRVSVGSGGYAGGITPNLIVHVHHDDPVIAKQDAMDLSQAMTYAFKQDAVPFFRADPALADKAQLGYRFRFKRKELTLTQERKMFKALQEELGPLAGYTKTRANELVLINYTGSDAFVESAEEFADIAKRFETKINEIAELEDTSVFGAESEYPYHDWTEQPAGEDLIKGLQTSEAGRSNILRRLDDVRESFKSSAREAVRSEGKEPRFSLRQTKTPEFKQWFGDSKQVNHDDFVVPDWMYRGVSDDEIIGSPKFWYHGTARDIGTFKPKQANSIFLSPDPDFAAHFSALSADSISEHSDELLSSEHQADLKVILQKIRDSHRAGSSLEDKLNEATKEFVLDRLNSGENIMPLYVRAEKTFDYENPAHIEILKPIISKRYTNQDGPVARSMQAQYLGALKKGAWDTLENPDIQKAIKGAGFDSYYVAEGGNKNLAVYSPNQVKSAVGNTGAFSRSNDDVKYSIRATSAQTKPQGRFDEANADLSPDMTAAINRTTTARKNEGWSDRIAAAFSPRSFTAFRQAFIHGADSISNLTRESALQFGEQEYHADRSAIAAVVFADRAAGIAASSFVNGPPVYKNGFASVPENSTVRGLIPILEPIMKGGAHMFQRFQFYAGTRRGSRLMYETRVGKDGKTITSTREQNFTKEDIERGKILEKMHPEFKQVFAEYQQYNNGLVQFMKDTGVISAKEAELWTKNWDYIPFYRQMDGDRINAPAIFSSISGVKKPKELKGGEAPLADFMETVIRNSRAAIEAGMKNVAGQRTIRDLQRLNQASEVPPATKGYDIVSIKQAGVTKFYKVDDSLVYEALKGLDAPHLPFVEILAKPANFLRDMVTKDPGFMLANLARDSMQAWVTSGVNMTPLFDTFKQAGKAMLGSNPEAAALARSGYFTGYDFAGDTKSSAAAVEKELRKRTGTQTAAEKALMPISKIMDILDKGAHISDLATRSEVYKRVLEETGNEAEATYQALEIMNFSRKGNSALIRIVTALVPFMNARIQGMDVLYRTGFGRSATRNNEQQKKLFATRSLTILGLTAMYLALAADTEEYKNATPEERDNYWILGGLGRIPIPFELGVLFKVFPERIYQHVWGMDTGADLRQSIARNLSSTLVMNPIPHVAMPIVENIANYSFFTGQPIVGKGMEDVYTPYQANPSTSLLAQLVGKETNQSPLKIDNLIRGYTGTIGTYAVMMLDAAMRGEGDDVKATKKLEQMPVFKRFMTTKQGSGTINAYYELKKEVDTAVKTVNFLERQGDYDELAVFQAGRGGKLLGIKDYMNGLNEEMSSLRTFRREARRSKMDPDNLAEIESNIKDAEINVTKNIQFVKKALD
jgi:hypothetical protein